MDAVMAEMFGRSSVTACLFGDGAVAEGEFQPGFRHARSAVR
jgi:TPP-dependent pyruvate/acetoin dehydrogenase alpha subunit